MIRGTIGPGRGISGERLARIPDLAEILGYEAISGTLNVRLSVAPRWEGGIPGGDHTFYPLTVEAHGRKVHGHAVRWKNDQRKTSIEIVAPVHLRTELRLPKRGRVVVTFREGA
ncbi:MAG: hypothetical protein EA417_13830 [Gammaproteobacteria bacterium]|nr:MAG: hypothetical protein EA417_13830 [Gammaproteobacteria bacterium]